MGCNSCKEKTVPEKLRSILDGWKHLIWKDEEVERIATERAKVCAECRFNKNSICKECGCYIPAKARSIVEECPLSKWKT